MNTYSMLAETLCLLAVQSDITVGPVRLVDGLKVPKPFLDIGSMMHFSDAIIERFLSDGIGKEIPPSWLDELAMLAARKAADVVLQNYEGNDRSMILGKFKAAVHVSILDSFRAGFKLD